MLEYLEPIKYGIIIFPFIALLITIPYILIHYHKYGSLPMIRVIIVYSFILYLLIAYFLIIMPLPSIEEVMNMTTPQTQLIPLMFIKDLIDGIKEVGINEFYNAPAFYTIFFNICLTIPFGVYLKFYFNLNFKQVVLCGFLLSLFFELTQLSGLYGIYPRSYRLFDVDDLIINTLGSIIGYSIGIFVSYIMPNINEVNKEAIYKGQTISFFRRLTSFTVDYILYSLFSGIMSTMFIFIEHKYIKIICLIIYYIVIPYKNGQTIANKFLNIKIISYQDEYLKLKKLVIRQLSFYIGVFILPKYIASTLMVISSMIGYEFRIIIMLFVMFAWFMYYLYIINQIKVKETLFYDKISKTKIISTINCKMD